MNYELIGDIIDIISILGIIMGLSILIWLYFSSKKLRELEYKKVKEG